LIGGEEVSGGTVVGIMSAIIISSFIAGSIVTNLQALEEARIAGRMAYDVIDAKVDVNPDIGGDDVKKEDLRGRIEFKKVNFVYPMRPDLAILKDFDCVIEEGKTTALVGPSGSGKSTIIQLIERFYKPKDGEILVDGKPIEKYDLR
jgi:ABC-type bacteriocin/lantibiotic exporter with double-glycine peptidase domain